MRTTHWRNVTLRRESERFSNDETIERDAGKCDNISTSLRRLRTARTPRSQQHTEWTCRPTTPETYNSGADVRSVPHHFHTVRLLPSCGKPSLSRLGRQREALQETKPPTLKRISQNRRKHSWKFCQTAVSILFEFWWDVHSVTTKMVFKNNQHKNRSVKS